jgi:hypothetical protein
MKRAMTYVSVWAGATTLAMLLVWFGARPVLHNAVFGEPPARPIITGPGASYSEEPSPEASASTPDGESSTVAVPSKTPSASIVPTTQDRTYVVKGGRVVLAVTPTMARLVSATPNPGYEVRTWHAGGWLRVDFTNGEREASLFATWNGHPPTVEVVD